MSRSSKRLGFLRNKHAKGNGGAFVNEFSVKSITSANTDRSVVYEIDSNRPNLTVNYTITDADSGHFQSASGNVTLDVNGNANITIDANIGYNYADTTNVNYSFNIVSPNNTEVVLLTNNNVSLVQPDPIVATGGTVTETDSGSGFEYAGYKVHTFTANANLTISNVGSNPGVDVNALIVAGGGAGGQSYTRSEYLFGALQQYDWHGGTGGGGGEANTLTSSISNLSTTNYPIVVGIGGTTARTIPPNSGQIIYGPASNSSIFGTISKAGGYQQSIVRVPSNSSGIPSATFTTRGGICGDLVNLGGQSISTEQNVGNFRTEIFAGGGGADSGYGDDAENGYSGTGSDGLASGISGTDLSYAGGGGGGGIYGNTNSEASGGAGGGGDGTIPGTQYISSIGGSATFYGGGGGGGGSSQADTTSSSAGVDKIGGQGYQGVVIVRYLEKYKLFNIN